MYEPIQEFYSEEQVYKGPYFNKASSRYAGGDSHPLASERTRANEQQVAVSEQHSVNINESEPFVVNCD